MKESQFLNLLSIQPPLISLHNLEHAIRADIGISEENKFVGEKRNPKNPNKKLTLFWVSAEQFLFDI